MKLHGFHDADRDGAEHLQVRAAEGDAIGLEGEVGVVAVERFGGSADFVVDFVGGFSDRHRCKAFGETHSRARRHVSGGICRGHQILLADDQAARFIEKRRGLRLFHSNAYADAVAGRGVRGDGEAGTQGLVVPFELGGLAGREVRADGLALQLEDHFAAHGRGKFHGEDAIFELDGEQFGGGVDDVLGLGELGAFVAEAHGSEGDIERQPERFARWNGDLGDDQGALGDRFEDAELVVKRQFSAIDDADGAHTCRGQFTGGDADGQLAGGRFGNHDGMHLGAQGAPFSQERGIAPQGNGGGPLIAAQADGAGAQQVGGVGRPARGIEDVLHVGPQDGARVSRGNGVAAAAEGIGIERGNGGHWRGRRGGVDGERAPFDVGDGAAVFGGLGGQQLFEAAQPRALRAGIGAGGCAVIEEAGHRRQGAHPGAEIELSKNADEGDEVAAGAGAAGEIVIAELELMPVPGDGKLHGIDADIFEPDELAFPEVARAEVVGELDGLHVVVRGRRGRRGQYGGEEHQQSGQALQNCLPFRTR